MLVLIHIGCGPGCKVKNIFYHHCLNLGPLKAKALMTCAALLLGSAIPGTAVGGGGSEWEPSLLSKGGRLSLPRSCCHSNPFLPNSNCQ